MLAAGYVAMRALWDFRSTRALVVASAIRLDELAPHHAELGLIGQLVVMHRLERRRVHVNARRGHIRFVGNLVHM
jgi:hypothetical protein